MTTPERLRRRQYIEGIIMVMLGILVVATSIVGERRDDQQDRRDEARAAAQIKADAKRDKAFRTCIVTQVAGIGTYLDARAKQTTARNDAVDTVIEQTAAAYAAQDLDAILRTLNGFSADKKAVEDERKKTKLPKFPTGLCEAGQDGGTVSKKGADK